MAWDLVGETPKLSIPGASVNSAPGASRPTPGGTLLALCQPVVTPGVCLTPVIKAYCPALQPVLLQCTVAHVVAAQLLQCGATCIVTMRHRPHCCNALWPVLSQRAMARFAATCRGCLVAMQCGPHCGPCCRNALLWPAAFVMRHGPHCCNMPRPKLSQPTPAGHCLTTVVRAEGPAWSSPASVFRPDLEGPVLAWNLGGKPPSSP